MTTASSTSSWTAGSSGFPGVAVVFGKRPHGSHASGLGAQPQLPQRVFKAQNRINRYGQPRLGMQLPAVPPGKGPGATSSSSSGPRPNPPEFHAWVYHQLGGGLLETLLSILSISLTIVLAAVRLARKSKRAGRWFWLLRAFRGVLALCTRGHWIMSWTVFEPTGSEVRGRGRHYVRLRSRPDTPSDAAAHTAHFAGCNAFSGSAQRRPRRLRGANDVAATHRDPPAFPALHPLARLLTQPAPSRPPPQSPLLPQTHTCAHRSASSSATLRRPACCP